MRKDISGRIRAAHTHGIQNMAFRGLIASFIVMLVVTFAGCGGGGGGGESAPAKAATAPTVKNVSISAEGDSTMYGNEFPGGVLRRSDNPAPAVAQATLQAKFGTTVTVKNNGIPGTTLAQDLAGMTSQYGSEPPLATKLASDSSQIVIENFGINDAANATVTPQSFHDSLTTWVSTVKNMGKIPVLEEPNPVTNPSYANLPALVAVIAQVANEQNVALISQYAYIQSLPNWQSMLTDGIHPSDALYEIKGQREAAVLGPIVANLMSK